MAAWPGYFLYSSHHSRYVFRGWLKAGMRRLLAHSSNVNICLEECGKFFDHLRAQGVMVHVVLSTIEYYSTQ